MTLTITIIITITILIADVIYINVKLHGIKKNMAMTDQILQEQLRVMSNKKERIINNEEHNEYLTQLAKDLKEKNKYKNGKTT